MPESTIPRRSTEELGLWESEGETESVEWKFDDR